MRFRSGPVTVKRSVFTGNEIGVRSFRGIAAITGNRIIGNEIGIFVREKGSGLEIHNNDLSGNSGYALRIGDFNDEDVKAAGNWWGNGSPETVIFDARQEEGIGFVRFEPALTAKPALGIKE
jgi:nitrous oxidase accessory protein NosD